MIWELKINIIIYFVALISYDEYASMKETLYLMSSKTNRERLDDAIDQIENTKFKTKELDI